MRGVAIGVTLALFACAGCAAASTRWQSAEEMGVPLQGAFAREVDKRLTLPDDERTHYIALLESALDKADKAALHSQFVVLVDRSPQVQALMIFWRSPEAASVLIGASPVTTGKPGTYEHFATPLGVFEHSLDNPDFRAEGTPNELGVRGYGERGMRVYDFGWVRTIRGWGKPAESVMRLQMHSTDPKLLEPKLGAAGSKGCIRIPATLNRFIDRYGLLDADYDEALKRGESLWVLPADRQATPWSGRYLVVIETTRTSRPAWASTKGVPLQACESKPAKK
jgi:hypothetical protein